MSGPAVPEPMAPAVQEEKKPKPGLERAKAQEAKAQERPGDAPSNRTPAPDRSRKSPAASRPSQRYEVQATEPPLPEGLGIEAARSEIDRTTGEASEELKMVQKARADANSIRARAQHLLDEAEAIQEEAQRVMARGRDSLAEAVSLNPRALRSVANTATALSEAMRTEWHLRRGIRQQAEADWAKQRATDAVLDSLAAVRKVSNCVNRELEEARRTAATGESLKESSQNDLRRANVMTAEAESLMRREAQRLLNQPGLGVNTFSPGPRANNCPNWESAGGDARLSIFGWA